jgi:SAM-dependent methyltransferase
MTTDRWSSGDAYEPFIGRWSRLVAREFVGWLDVAPGARWLDVGCGTGALTQTILDDAAPDSVVGVDPSAAYVAHCAAHVTDPRATFRTGDALALPVDDDAADVVASGLVLNFVPDPVAAVAEMARAGATVAAYVWDYAEGMQLLRVIWDAAADLDPAARELDEGVRFPLCTPDALRAAFAALDDVEVTGITVDTVFADFADYWTPFLGGQGPAPSYVASLADEQAAALRESVRAQLPVAADGTIPLTARAWAVRGRRRAG